MKAKTIVFAMLVLLLSGRAPAKAQNANDPRSTTAGQDSQSTLQSNFRDSQQDNYTYSDGSILTSIVEGTRNKLGFAFSADTTYTPDRVLTTTGQGASVFSNFDATMFANFRTRRSGLGLSYSFGYRMSNGGTQSLPVHSGNVRYSYSLGRSTTLSANNTFSSTLNDYGYGVPNAFVYQGQGSPVYQIEVFLDRQRVARNVANVAVDFAPTRNSTFRISGSHTALWYEKTTGEVQGFQAAVDGGYKLNRWLTLGSGYTAYFNPGTASQHQSLIHRAQFASFGFQLPLGIHLQTNGGIEYTHEGGRGIATTGIQMGWERSGRYNSLSVDYHRGFSKALGPGIVIEGNDVGVSFEQRITDRIHFNAGAQALDGSGRLGGSLRNLSSGAGFEFLLVENLVASVNGGFAYQRARAIAPNATNVSRYTVTAGVSYVIPVGGR